MQTSTSFETIREHVRVAALLCQLCNLRILMLRKWQLGDNLTIADQLYVSIIIAQVAEFPTLRNFLLPDISIFLHKFPI